MTITSQIAIVATWISDLEIMSDEDYVNNDVWNTVVLAADSGSWIGDFCGTLGIVDPDRYTAIVILMNFRLTQCVIGFTHEI